MYLPSAFKDNDPQSLQDMIQQCRLATLVTLGEFGLQANHVPLLFDPAAGPHGTLHGHLARANRQWQDLAAGAEALVIFNGPDAYISPGYYPSKAEHGKAVPTWNFLAVHAWGQAEVFTDPQRLQGLLTRLTAQHEAGQASPWTLEQAPAGYIDGMLKAIVGFSLPISRIEGKRKLSQNRNAVDIEGVRQNLANSDKPHEQQIAQLMGQA